MQCLTNENLYKVDIYLSDFEIHNHCPSWPIFHRRKHWRRFRRELQLNHKDRWNEFIVRIDVGSVWQFEARRAMIDARFRAKHVHSDSFEQRRSRRRLLLMTIVIRSYAYVELAMVALAPGMIRRLQRHGAGERVGRTRHRLARRA